MTSSAKPSRPNDEEETRAQWRSRGYLPHFDAAETPQVITFRLVDSLPAAVLDLWEAQLRLLPKEKAPAEFRRRMESYLDAGHGQCWLKDPRLAEMVQQALLYFDGERYHMHAWTVMPNHVHVLVTLKADVALDAVLHSWKSYTAKEANRYLGRTGPFWQPDYFDRAVRDERHFAAAVAYIEGNPVKAGLCQAKEEWPFSSAGIGGQGGQRRELR